METIVAVVAVAVLAVVVAWVVAGPGDGVDATLADAVDAGDAELARSLLAAGDDPDEPRVHALTPLMRAAIRDDAAMVRLLLDAGADIAATDNDGQSALHVAAQTDSAVALAALIEAGADPGSRSHNGMNTFEHAAAWGSVEVIAQIAALGVDLDARSEVITQGHGHPRDVGSTALGIAARAGQVAAIELLLGLGAAVDAPSTSGHSPLMLAVFSDQSPEVASALLAGGADPLLAAGGDQRTALDWAGELEREELVPLLEAAADSQANG
jgi:ankyrin repeat protein